MGTARENKQDKDVSALVADVSEVKTTIKFVQKDIADTRQDIKDLATEVITARTESEIRLTKQISDMNTSLKETINNNHQQTKGELKTLSDRITSVEGKTTNTPLVEKIVFGLTGIILVSVATAIVALVVISGK